MLDLRSLSRTITEYLPKEPKKTTDIFLSMNRLYLDGEFGVCYKMTHMPRNRQEERERLLDEVEKNTGSLAVRQGKQVLRRISETGDSIEALRQGLLDRATKGEEVLVKVQEGSLKVVGGVRTTIDGLIQMEVEEEKVDGFLSQVVNGLKSFFGEREEGRRGQTGVERPGSVSLSQFAKEFGMNTTQAADWVNNMSEMGLAPKPVQGEGKTGAWRIDPVTVGRMRRIKDKNEECGSQRTNKKRDLAWLKDIVERESRQESPRAEEVDEFGVVQKVKVPRR